MNNIGPSIKLLPMKDIKDELRNNQSFALTTDVAPDTAKVSGTNSNLIAVVATDANGVPFDSTRSTVTNSLNLNGHLDTYFFTKTEGDSVVSVSDAINELVAAEVSSLRDELYQIRGELVRQGFMKNFTLYSGFQDFFKDGDKLYTSSVAGISQDYPTTVNKIIPTDPKKFSKKDYFLIVQNDDLKTAKLTRVSDVDSGGNVTFEGTAYNLAAPTTKLYKSKGEYVRGSFSFSHVEKNIDSNKEKYTMLNDDTNPVVKLVDGTTNGYGIQIRVPKATVGFMSKFTVLGRSIGSPSALRCHVIKASDLLLFKSVAQAATDGLIVATSEAVNPSSTAVKDLHDIEFNFTRDIITGRYPEVENLDYVFIIEADSLNALNYWEMQFCSSRNSANLQTNYNNFVYIPGTGLDGTTMDAIDMYFTLTTKEKKDEVETLYSEGLYTVPINLPQPTDVFRARLTMKVNKEGLFKVSSTDTITADSFSLTNTTEGIYKDYMTSGISKGDIVVVDKSFATVTGVDAANSNRLTLDNNLGVSIDDSVYRVGYKVQLKAIKNEDVYKTIDLPLIAIMPNGYNASPLVSDRLIFEAVLSDATLKDLKDFELQIKWNSHLPLETIDPQYVNDLAGRIYSMTLSFDKAM